MLQISHLRCFVTVATELHFGRAAQRLNMTQAPLSRQIQALEHTLGLSLFFRDRRAVQLTPAGVGFLPEARDILLRCELAMIAARRAAKGEAGTVRLGFIAAARFKVFPVIVSEASKSLSSINIELKEISTLEQQEALVSKRIDLGLIRPDKFNREIETVCVLREPFVPAVHTSNPLSWRENISVMDLHQQPFIMYSPSEGRYSFEILSGIFRTKNIEPDYVQYLYQTHTILSLVDIGMGSALVPESAQHTKTDNVVFRQVDLGNAQVELHLAWRKGEIDPVTLKFKSFVLEHFPARDS